MRDPSPYRGILLYHGLGSGKTCTAIQIAEALKQQRNIVFMSPASLRDNFISQGILFCGDPAYQRSSLAWKNKYTFISYNASNVADQLEALGNLDNRVILIEEVHNLVSRIVSSLVGNSKNGRIIYEMLMTAKNTKIICMSGTPLVNSPAELAILFNILRGMMDVAVFRIEGGTLTNAPILEDKLRELDNVDYVSLRLGNKTCEVMLRNHSAESIASVIDHAIQTTGIEMKKIMTRRYTAFPDQVEAGDFESFFNYFIEEDQEGYFRMKNRELFQRRIMGLVSYYWVHDSSYPQMIDKGMIDVPMSEYQYQLYQIVRAQEKTREKSSMKKKRAGLQSKSMFRVFSREFSNFVFPESMRRPFPNPDFEKVIYAAMRKSGNGSSSRMSKRELDKMFKAEDSNNDEDVEKVRLNKLYMQRIHQAIEQLSTNRGEFLSREGLRIYSPKMGVILDNIQQSPGNVFVYSQFTLLEGAQVMSLVLETAGYHRYGTPGTGPAYALFTGEISFEDRAKVIRAFNADDNLHGEKLKVLIASSAGAEGLDLKNVRQIHILEPYWNEVKMEQVIGRGVRRNSHIALPPAERNVEVYRYLSVFTENQKQRSPEPESTDQHVYQIAYKKALIKNELLQILRESAVDCRLNAADNMKKGQYTCFSYGSGAKGLGSIPDIAYDAVSGNSRSSRRVIRAKLVKGMVTKGGDVLIADKEKRAFFKATDLLHDSPVANPEPARVVYVDVENQKVYDYQSMKTSKQTILLGSYDPLSTFMPV